MISVLPQMLWAQNHYESGNIKIENNAKEDSTLSIVLHFANDVIVEHDSIVNDRQSIIVGLFNRADISEISYYLLTKDNIVKCVFNNYELKSKNIYKIQNSFLPVVDEIFKSLDKLLTKSYDNSKPIKGFYPSPQPGYISLTHDTYYFYIKDKKNKLESVVYRDKCYECHISDLQQKFDEIDWAVAYIEAFHE